jgi:hypothetical protein
MGILSSLNNPDITPRENELHALSELFSQACLVGKWSLDPAQNEALSKLRTIRRWNILIPWAKNFHLPNCHILYCTLISSIILINKILRRVRLTIVAVENNKYYIFWVYVYCLKYPVCKAHASHCTVICGLSGCTLFLHIPSNINSTN